MSYNLYAEGVDLDYFELAGMAQRFERLELFPIPGPPDALGIALPLARADDNAIAELEALIGMLLPREIAVYDLVSGDRISSVSDLEALAQRIAS
jgi:hypothetical protein